MLTISKPLSAGQAQAYHAKEFTAKEQNYWSERGVIQGEWHRWPRRDEYPSSPGLGPFGRCPDGGGLVLSGQEPKAVRTHIKGAEYPCPLLRSLWIGQHPILGSLDAAVNLFRVGHPLNQVFRRWQIAEKVREYLLWSLDEKAIRHAFGLIE